MAAPKYEIVHKHIQNPHASAPLIIPIAVISNTSDEVLANNIRANAALDLPWLAAHTAHERAAIMVGGGPSAADYLEDIRALQRDGGTIFAMNGASRWLRRHGITPDFQVICDAKAETATLVDPDAAAHLFASQVNPETMRAVERPTLWHLGAEEIETLFPAARKARGGYVILGGGAAVGNSALCVAYAMGFRQMHLYGYDSSHRDGESHAYSQPMNAWIPTVDVEWAGRTFTTSIAMKAQAEKFRLTSRQLEQMGCVIQLYGDGLLQHMATAEPENLTERDKYRLLWQFDSYRVVSPGELMADAFLEIMQPDGLVIDFGCGTGRAALKIHEAGLPVLLIDFADNCRDQEALGLPFIEADLARPCPARGRVGLCADVMEHIPADQVERVVANMMEACPRMFFQIDTEQDVCGALIGHELHVTIWPHARWREMLSRFGAITHEHELEGKSIFVVERV